MPEIPYRGVTGNDVSDEHLRSHGLTLDDANEVRPSTFLNLPDLDSTSWETRVYNLNESKWLARIFVAVF